MGTHLRHTVLDSHLLALITVHIPNHIRRLLDLRRIEPTLNGKLNALSLQCRCDSI
jgi:hypothetical protein